jgi:hypothetical protein
MASLIGAESPGKRCGLTVGGDDLPEKNQAQSQEDWMDTGKKNKEVKIKQDST